MGVTKLGAYYSLGNCGKKGLQICFVWQEEYYCTNTPNFEKMWRVEKVLPYKAGNFHFLLATNPCECLNKSLCSHTRSHIQDVHTQKQSTPAHSQGIVITFVIQGSQRFTCFLGETYSIHWLSHILQETHSYTSAHVYHAHGF